MVKFCLYCEETGARFADRLNEGYEKNEESGMHPRFGWNNYKHGNVTD